MFSRCTKLIRPLISALVAVSLIAAPVVAYPVTMQDMFNSMSNTTPAGAYYGQTQNVYTGGSMELRIPQKNYSMASFAPPSIKGGCGGISAFGGSFSFINAQQFVDMLQNIGSAALSQAFFMAIDSMSPMVGVNLKQLMDKLQKATNQSINSCETGKAFASNMMNNTGVASGIHKWAEGVGKEVDFLTNGANDFFASEESVKANPSKTQDNLKQAVAERKRLTGNLVWAALAQYNKTAIGEKRINEFEARLIISFVGTQILVTGAEQKNKEVAVEAVQVYPTSSIGFLQNFIGNDEVSTLTDFYIYTCQDGNESGDANGVASTDPDHNRIFTPNNMQCIKMNPVAVNSAAGGGSAYKNILTLVTERMHSINDTILNDTYAMSEVDKSFINRTTIPVYKMLAVSNALKRSGLGVVMINNNKKIIAAEYANAYINSLFEILLLSLGQLEAVANAPYKQATDEIKTRISEVRKAMALQIADAYQAQTSMNFLAEQIMAMEKTMLGNMPNSLSGAMSMKKR